MGNETRTKENDIMKTVKKREKSRKVRIVLLVVVILLVAVGVNAQNRARRAGTAMQETMAAMQTDEVTRHSLIKSVGATGTIVSIDSEDVSAALSNVEVESVLVEIGDTVYEGQELVYFDTADMEENLADAKKSLNDATAKNDISAEEAARKVTDAERNYERQIENAREAIEESDYAKIVDYIYALETKVSEPELSDEEREARIAEYEARLPAAEAAYEAAMANYEEVIETQESSLASAKNSQATTNLSLSTDNEESLVEQYEKQLAESVVTAPISGIVTAINYEAGDTYTQGAMVTIQDCSAFEVEAYIGEYDISDIKKGQKVLIKTDATGEEELEGTVVFVSPTAADGMTNGDVSYLVRISVDTPNERLRLDMSASLSIIIEQHEDAMTVPYNAVQEDETGGHFVEVVAEDGSTAKVPVTIVMESNYYTEIASDSLTEGQKVRIINTESNGFFDMMGGRGGF